jgi:hypothetical protein
MLCWTKAKTSKLTTQDCHKRNLVYETWCITCQRKDEEEIEEMHRGDAGKIKEIKMKMKIHKYVGETSRSIFERTQEHKNDIEALKTSSHMLRHLLDRHENDSWKEVEFGAKVLRFTRSSFERQLLESVLIQENRDHHLLNSRSEYNRCAIPRLATKMGEKDIEKWKEEEIEMQKKKGIWRQESGVSKRRGTEQGCRTRDNSPQQRDRRLMQEQYQ